MQLRFRVITCVAHCAPHYRIVLLLHKTVVVFAIRARAREAQFLLLAVSTGYLLMNSESLSLSMPSKEKGSFWRISFKAAKTQAWALLRTASVWSRWWQHQ